MSAWLDRLTTSLLGSGLAGSPSWKTPAAVAKPWLHPAAAPALVESLAEKALSLFRTSWEESFTSFPNLDLAEGMPDASSRLG
jgi:hypothetical protein